MIFRFFPEQAGEIGQCHSAAWFQLDVAILCTYFQAHERSMVHSDDLSLP